MLVLRYHILFALAIFALVSASVPTSVFAGKINLILSDFDAVYRGDTQLLQDAKAATGGNMATAEADKLETAVLEHDDTTVEVILPADATMHLDFQLVGFPNSLDLSLNTPVTIATTGFGLDWFTEDGHYLRLKIESVDVLLTRGVFLLSTEAIVLDQALPQDLRFPDVVSVSFTATLPAVQAGPTTSMATASGVVTISGLAVLVPEPVAASLCALALAIGCGCTRRTRWI